MADARKIPVIINAIFYLLGICSLLPWNVFITADSFWQYKLRNTSFGENATSPDGGRSHLQITFTPTLVVLSNVLNLVFTFATAAFSVKYRDQCRIFVSFALTITSMIAVTVLGIVNTDNWQEEFFGFVMVLISMLTVGIAIFQASLYGLAGIFGKQETTSFISGQAISGLVSSFAIIISLAMGKSDPITSGIAYFIISDVILIFSLLTYIYLTRMEQYNMLRSQATSDTKSNNFFTKENYREIKSVIKKVKWFAFSSGMVLLVTLSIFPAVQVYVTSNLPDSTWTAVYFQPTFTFVVFNLFDVFGREVARYYKWPGKDGLKLPMVTTLRIVFIPLILLCNGQQKTFPILFYNDAFYFVINSLFAFSNGYLFSLSLQYYSSFVKDTEVELAGTIIASGMGIGLTAGSAISPGLVALWGPKRQ